MANSNMLFAVAVIAGALGEDITKIFTNIQVIFEFLKKSSKTSADIDPIVTQIVDAIKAADDDDNANADNKSDN